MKASKRDSEHFTRAYMIDSAPQGSRQNKVKYKGKQKAFEQMR